MTEQEMIDCLQLVWENMTEDKDRNAYTEMLLLLDEMREFLRYDLQIEYHLPSIEIKSEAFYF